MRYEAVDLNEIRDNGLHLVEANCEETGAGDIDCIAWDKYQIMAEVGALLCFAMYDGDKMVGYAAFVVSVNLKNVLRISAHNDLIYVSPSHRTKALTFCAFMERFLAGEGVHDVHYSLPEGHRFGLALCHLGFKRSEVIYKKELNQWQKQQRQP